MIRLMLGKMGSGKTVCSVREIINDDIGNTVYTNIIVKGRGVDNVVTINRDMIVKDEVVRVKQNGDPVVKKRFNAEYWKGIRSLHPDGVSVVIDEAHTVMDSRRSMSGDNVIMNDFMALLRRVLGDSGGYGELVLITQLGRRLDVNARELATSIHYHVCHYVRSCPKCGFSFRENNEVYDKPKRCPRCGGRGLKSSDFVIEKWEFDDYERFELWHDGGVRSYVKHYFVTDIERYFKFYDTFQWENLISEY